MRDAPMISWCQSYWLSFKFQLVCQSEKMLSKSNYNSLSHKDPLNKLQVS